MKASLLTISLLLVFITGYSQSTENKVYSVMVSLWPREDHSPRYPRKKTQDTSLLANIVLGIRSGKVQAYADSQFMRPMAVAAVNEIVKAKSFVDTFFFLHSPNGDELVQYIDMDFEFYAVTDFRILAKGKSDVHFLGLGIDRPSAHVSHDDKYGDPEPFPLFQTLFWVKYSQVKAIVDKYNKIHPGNQLTLRSAK